METFSPLTLNTIPNISLDKKIMNVSKHEMITVRKNAELCMILNKFLSSLISETNFKTEKWIPPATNCDKTVYIE
jgi:hypothetical protein